MSHSYPRDISREQFARILPDLESARRRTKPRTVDLYDVFCGVLYLLKSGRQWLSRASTRCTTAAERNCPTGAMTRESRGSSKQGDPSGTGGDS